MMNFQKLIKPSNFFLFISLVIFLPGCTKEVPQKKYIAKVNNAYLTEEQLDLMSDSSKGNHLFKSEIIRNWINRELLYQEALKEGILNGAEYKKILEDSKKELAGSLLLKKFYEQQKNSVSETEVENFYKKNINEFKLPYNSYLFNKITFDNEDKALEFRSIVLKEDWNEAENNFKDDTSVVDYKNNSLLYEYEIRPASILRIIKELYPDEVSIVLRESPDRFMIVQILQKFDKGIIPPLDYIYSEVKKRYLVKKKELTIKDYIKELYSKNDIEVKN